MLAVVTRGTNRRIAAQRQERILSEVRQRGAVRVSELARSMSVSDMTIRRDLDSLDVAGLVVKVHGGATAPAGAASDEPGFDAKSLRNPDEKDAIGRRAARLVHDGDAIGVTAGTTTWRLAHAVLDVADLTVVTNSLRVADLFATRPRPDRTVIVTGGVRTRSDALVGPIAVNALRDLRVDRLFLGVHGMSERGGFTTPNMLEGETNRAFIDAAAETVVVLDHTKWGVTGLSCFADFDDVDVVVTDDGLGDDAVERIRSLVGGLILVESESRPVEGHDPASDIRIARGA